MLLISMASNCYSLGVKPAKERPKVLLNLIKELESAGARMSKIPLFKSLEEAKAFGLVHWQDDAMIQSLFKKACEYKEIALSTNLEYALDQYLNYKAAWEVARFGTKGARLIDIKPLVIALATLCPSCSAVKHHISTIVSKDESVEFDVAVAWQLDGKNFIWFPRSNNLYVIEGELRRLATPEERDIFNHAKALSNNPS